MLLKEAQERTTRYDHRFGNAGPQLPGVQYDSDADPATDSAAFDQLGPKTREVMRNMPVRWSARKTLDAMRGQRMDPRNPQHDDYMAQMLLKNHPHVIKMMRDIDNQTQGLTMREAMELSEASYSAKAAAHGKDIGQKGKNFSKIAAGAAEKYGSKEAGERVAGAVLAKIRAKHGG